VYHQFYAVLSQLLVGCTSTSFIDSPSNHIFVYINVPLPYYPCTLSSSTDLQLAVLLITRTYALYGRARWVLYTLVGYTTAAVAVSVWAVISSPSQHATEATHTGCQSGLSVDGCVSPTSHRSIALTTRSPTRLRLPICSRLLVP
jgi:hypothetical protein